MIIDQNSHIINVLDGRFDHPLIRKNSRVPFRFVHTCTIHDFIS